MKRWREKLLSSGLYTEAEMDGILKTADDEVEAAPSLR